MHVKFSCIRRLPLAVDRGHGATFRWKEHDESQRTSPGRRCFASSYCQCRRAANRRKIQSSPPAHHQGCKIITTNGGRQYRWVFLKIITSEPGLYGIGSASNHFQTMAVVAALESHLKPWLIGKDPDRIEDLWQAAQMRTYWRNGPVNNNVLVGDGHGLVGHQRQARRHAGL